MMFKTGLVALSLLALPSESSESLECYDAYECEGETYYRDFQTFCHGLKSCYNTNFTLEDISPQAYGELSLANSYVLFKYRPEEDNDDPYEYGLPCYGDRSCSMSELIANDRTDFNAYGNLALYNSIINASDEAVRTRLYLYGAFAGYKATFNCNYGACYVTCSGNGCTGLELYEPYDSSDGDSMEMYEYDNIEINCDRSEYNKYCPDGYDMSEYQHLIPNFAEEMMYPFSTYNNSKSLCTSFPNNTVLPDLQCCSRASSCEEVDLSLQSDPTTGNDTGIAIRCDGRYSCDSYSGGDPDAITRYFLQSTGGGDMYATAEQAAEYRKIETDMDSNVICTGSESCAYSIITTANNVYGTGEESLRRSTIRGVNNVYCYAQDVCYQMNATNVYENIYCVGRSTCQSVYIKGVSNIYSNGDGVLTNAEINDVSGMVLGAGYNALEDAEMQNVDTVVCLGYEACLAIEIDGVRRMNATGYHSLDNAEITTNLGGGDFLLYVNETMDIGDPRITCSDGDICNIFCVLNTACLGIECNGNCTITYKFVDTPAPSEPTVEPTDRPTGMPSEPTKAPTVTNGSINHFNININKLIVTVFVIIAFVVDL